MKPAPKLYALLKRAIKRESLRIKLQRSDEPESRVDQKTLEEQVCVWVCVCACVYMCMCERVVLIKRPSRSEEHTSELQ